MSKFKKWWDNESGWGEDAPVLAEGKLARDAWNAALLAASEECMKDEKRESGGVGARYCTEIYNAITALREI